MDVGKEAHTEWLTIKHKSVFAGRVPLWHLRQAEGGNLNRYFIHFPPILGWIGGCYSFGGWEQFCNYLFMWINFSVKMRQTGISLGTTLNCGSVPAHSSAGTVLVVFSFHPCAYPTRGALLLSLFYTWGNRGSELWMARCNGGNRSRASDVKVLFVLPFYWIGTTCKAQGVLGSGQARSETSFRLLSPPLPPVMWEVSGQVGDRRETHPANTFCQQPPGCLLRGREVLPQTCWCLQGSNS